MGSRSVPGPPRQAWARRLLRLPARPRIAFEWSHGSGDGDPFDRVNGTFDPFWISTHRHYGERDIAAHRNLQYLNSGVRLHPRKGLEIEAEFISHPLSASENGLSGASALR